MNDPNTFWFHCGRCGSLFESQPGDIKDRLCAKCGADPRIGILEAPPEPVAAIREPATPEPESNSSSREQPEKRSGKRRRNRHSMLKLIGGWILVLALIISIARLVWHDETPEKRPPTASETKANRVSDEDLELLTKHLPACMDTFSRFLATTTPEERNQFVLKPVTTAARMARFYGMNSLAAIDPKTIELESRSILNLPAGKAIETRWKSQDGKILDALFREENGTWLLDWDYFARYSDYPWALFLAGSGDPEAEFRLLARERKVEERKDKATTISLVLYAPRFGHPLDPGFQSPEFLVQRDSKEGKLLEAAFRMAENGKHAFGSSFVNPNPESMVRVRVKVRRTEVDRERTFEITGVPACHWYSVDEPGVEP